MPLAVEDGEFREGGFSATGLPAYRVLGNLELPVLSFRVSSLRLLPRAPLFLVCPFVYTAVSPLNDVPGHFSAADPKRYRRGQPNPAEHDQKRRRRKLHRDPKLGDGCEDRIDDDGVSGDVRQDVRACSPPDYAREEIRQKGR